MEWRLGKLENQYKFHGNVANTQRFAHGFLGSSKNVLKRIQTTPKCKKIILS